MMDTTDAARITKLQEALSDIVSICDMSKEATPDKLRGYLAAIGRFALLALMPASEITVEKPQP